MKGYLTIFFSLSLSIMTGFVLVLTGCAIKQAEKVRLECTADTGMSAIVLELCTVLLNLFALSYLYYT